MERTQIKKPTACRGQFSPYAINEAKALWSCYFKKFVPKFLNTKLILGSYSVYMKAYFFIKFDIYPKIQSFNKRRHN